MHTRKSNDVRRSIQNGYTSHTNTIDILKYRKVFTQYTLLITKKHTKLKHMKSFICAEENLVNQVLLFSYLFFWSFHMYELT